MCDVSLSVTCQSVADSNLLIRRPKSVWNLCEMASDKTLLDSLKNILGDHVEPAIVEYIKSMKSKEDLDEFLENMLDVNNGKHLAAYKTISNVLFTSSQQREVKTENIAVQPRLTSEQRRHPAKQRGKKTFKDMKTFSATKKQSKGRIVCDCEGQTHEFMNNCLNCGRIHCMEEGPGPCLFCSEPISLLSDAHSVDSQSSGKLNAKNIKHRENSVFDDDKDYFKSKSGQSGGDRRKMVIALDFASRKVIDSTAEDVKIKERLHGHIKKHLENVDALYKNIQKHSTADTAPVGNDDLIDLMIRMRHKDVKGVENLGPEDSKAHVVDYGKIFDEDILAVQDHGMCLSMHQPYASLLVAGVKKHEGRSWKTNHRGRLWIAAAAKAPEDDDIDSVECFYQQYYHDDTLKLPRVYPTGCVLGCVHVDDCLDQDAYRKMYPNGESSSPYVLICSNPIILPIFYPIIGQHKIYPLDKQLHNCVKLSIRHAKYGVD